MRPLAIPVLQTQRLCHHCGIILLPRGQLTVGRRRFSFLCRNRIGLFLLAKLQRAADLNRIAEIPRRFPHVAELHATDPEVEKEVCARDCV